MNVDEKTFKQIGYKVSQYLFLLLHNMEEVVFIRNNPDKQLAAGAMSPPPGGCHQRLVCNTEEAWQQLL